MIDDFIVPLVGGALSEYFQSRGISKKKVFVVSFFVFSGLFFAYIFLETSDYIDEGTYAVTGYAAIFGIFMASFMTTLLWLNEVLIRRKNRKLEKQSD